MVLDGALAYAEARGDILAGIASQNQFHDFALSQRQPRDVVGRVLPPGKERARVPWPSPRALTRSNRVPLAWWDKKLPTCGTLPRTLKNFR